MLMISACGSCLFGGCIYSLDSLVGVIPMLVFPVCWDDEYDDTDALKHLGVLKIYKILLICMVVHLLVWIINCGESTCSRRNDDLSFSVTEIMSYSSVNTVTAYGCGNWGVFFCHSLGLHSLLYSACKGQYSQACSWTVISIDGGGGFGLGVELYLNSHLHLHAMMFNTAVLTVMFSVWLKWSLTVALATWMIYTLSQDFPFCNRKQHINSQFSYKNRIELCKDLVKWIFKISEKSAQF
jgi:hypothetical protein